MEEHFEVYKTVCSARFETIENNQRDMAENITAIREKVFDGFSDAIEQTREDVEQIKKDTVIMRENSTKIDKLQESLDEMKESTEKKKRSHALLMRDIILTVLGSGGIVSLILSKILS